MSLGDIVDAEHVTGFSDRDYVTRIRWIALELPTKLDHVRIHRPRLDIVVIRPYFVEQAATSHDRIRATRERSEQVELARPERDGLTAFEHRAALELDLNVAESDGRRAAPVIRVGREPSPPAKERVDAREKLAQRERLRDVVIRADAEPAHLLGLPGAG